MRTPSAMLALPLLLALRSPAARADVFVIPLPEVAGTYAAGPAPAVSQRTATFHLPGTPAAIHGASLHVRGTTQVGTMTCGGPSGPIVSAWPTIVVGRMPDAATNNYWTSIADMPTVAGSFEWTAPFTTFASFVNPLPASWAFLADGSGDLTLAGGPDAVLLDCQGSKPPPAVTVEQAWLLVDADIPTPAHGASWGQLKAIYR